MKAPSFGLVLVAAFAVGTGINGLYDGVTDFARAPNTLASVVAVLKLIMGITGLSGAVLVWRQDRRATPLIIVWGASAISAAVLAPRAYAPEVGWTAAILAGVTTAVLVVTIVLYARWRLGVTAAGESSPAS